MKHNPYTILFGREPLQLIPRSMEVTTILSSFYEDPPAQQVYMIAGVRGSGKTVLMTETSEKIRQDKNWIVIELNPERNLLEDFVSKLNSDRILSELFRRSKINLSFLGIGIDIEGVPPITNLETAAEHMLRILQKKGKRVLVTIDEVVSTPAMKEFAHAFQIYIRQNYPLYLLMTGLYENIDTLQNERSLTFLYRAPKLELQPLSLRTIAKNYRETFKISDENAEEMASFTRGYSFAFQVLGYLTWQNGGSHRDVLEDYRNYLADYSYDKIWSELSPMDQRIAYAVAQTDSRKIADIRGTLQMDTNHFNPYRKRLIRKGVLDGSQYGYLRFTLPLFEEYVLDNFVD